MADVAGCSNRDADFLIYRSADEPYGVQLLDQALSALFGDEVVFLASKSIRPGEDWEKRRLAAVAASAAVLVIIGRNWLDAKDAEGRPKLEKPADFVRREIRAGLDLGKKVIPVRLGVPRLTPEVLPEALRDLRQLCVSLDVWPTSGPARPRRPGPARPPRATTTTYRTRPTTVRAR
jgi:hypothetical protein